MPLEAIDSLMQGVTIHDALTEYAESLGVGEGFEALYQEILGYLSGVFGVSEDRAKEISRITDDLQYTMELLDIVDPSWRDEIEPTVELTEGGAAMPEYTGQPPVPEEPEAEPEPEPEAETESSAPPEEPPSEGENTEGEGGEDGGSSGGQGSFTLTPDSETEITNSDGSHIEVSEPETNTGSSDEPAPQPVSNPGGSPGGGDPGDQNTASDGTTLYSFNVQKGADGRYHQTN